MRKIVHISDLHFGADEPVVAQRLAEAIVKADPSLLIVSGDLTQRARSSQFKRARKFLNLLPQPQLVVPGNHDVPLYNLYDRFANPLEKYSRYITSELEPFFSDDALAVAGINTTKSMTIKGGRVTDEHVARIRARMRAFGEKVLKVVVTHHPFDVPEGEDESDIVGRAEETLPKIAECGADVFLAGHLHKSHISHSARRYRLDNGYSALIIQAGTGTSVRERGEDNAFNIMEFEHPVLTVHRFLCTIPTEGFRLADTERFTHTIKGWVRM